MIYGSGDRLDYPTCKVIETNTYIIINGVTFDKKTLAKINITPLEVGFYNMEDHKKNLALEICHSIQPLYNAEYMYWYGTASEREIATHRTTVVDNKNSEIEWVIHGDGIIKYNTTNKTYNVYRLTESLFKQNPIFDSFFLHQDDNFIYIGCHAGEKSSGQNTLKTVVVNKASCTASFVDNILSGYYASQVEILKRDDNNVYLYLQDLYQNYIKKVTCAGGKITVNDIEKTSIPDPANYMGSMPTKLLKNEYFYRLDADNKIGYYRLQAGDTIEKIEEQSLLEEVKIKSANFIKTKFNIPDEQWNAEKTNYLQMETSQMVSYRIWRCFTMGDNDEYLVVVNTAGNPTKSSNSTDNGKTEKVLVYKRNNPDTEPLDLTLVDYKTKNDLFVSSYSLGPILKLNPKTLYGWGDFGVMVLDLQDNGTLTPKYYHNSRISTFGFDKLGRLYTHNKDNSVVEMFTDTLPYDLEIKYENTSDAYVPYNNTPVTKNILVTSKNIWGKPVMASFELGCTGNSEFTTSSSNLIRGNTNEQGTATVPLKIKGPTTVTVGKKLLYNNELQYVEKAVGQADAGVPGA